MQKPEQTFALVINKREKSRRIKKGGRYKNFDQKRNLKASRDSLGTVNDRFSTYTLIST